MKSYTLAGTKNRPGLFPALMLPDYLRSLRLLRNVELTQIDAETGWKQLETMGGML